MRAPGVSSWDQLAVAYPDEPVGEDRSLDAIAAARCKLRIAPFEDACDKLSGSDPPEAVAWKLALLSNDLRRRRERWLASEAPTMSGGSSSDPRPWRKPWYWIAIPAAVLMAAIPYLAGATLGSLPGIALLAAALIHLAISARREKLNDTTSGRRCPTCTYDLRGLRPAIPTHLLKGLNAGPRECPECGTRWPLVPPGDYPEL